MTKDTISKFLTITITFVKNSGIFLETFEINAPYFVVNFGIERLFLLIIKTDIKIFTIKMVIRTTIYPNALLNKCNGLCS